MRPEEDVRSPESGVVGGCESLYKLNSNQNFSAHANTKLPSFQHLESEFLTSQMAVTVYV